MTERKQLGALYFCGLSVPAILIFPSLHPAKVVAASFFAMLLWHCKPKKQFGMALMAIICLAVIVNWAKQAYPTAQHTTAMSLILLAASAYCARNGIRPLLRTAAISFFFVVTIYIVIIAFGIGNIGTIRPLPKLTLQSEDWYLLWLLLPLCGIDENPASKGWHFAWLAIAVLPSILCRLNPIGEVDFPFYTLTKSISILGIMERFEPILSAALTTGIFLLMGIFSHICTERIKGGELIAIAASFLPQGILIALSAALITIYWGAIPILAQGIAKYKKLEKS